MTAAASPMLRPATIKKGNKITIHSLTGLKNFSVLLFILIKPPLIYTCLPVRWLLAQATGL